MAAMLKKSGSEEERMMLKVPYIIKREEDGFTIECVDLSIVTQGDTLKEARKNIIEAITLHFQSAEELGILDQELEKLGVTKKNRRLETAPRELGSASIEIPC